MTDARIVRADRVLHHRRRLVARIEADLGACLRRSVEARDAVIRSKREWEAAASAPEQKNCSSADLALTNAYRLDLARKVDASVAFEKQLRLEEQACEKRLLAAKVEVRKIEIWRDGILEGIRAEENTQERRAMDNIAARIARSA